MTVLLMLVSNSLLADIVYMEDKLVTAAVPETGTFALPGVGIAGLVIVRTRKKQLVYCNVHMSLGSKCFWLHDGGNNEEQENKRTRFGNRRLNSGIPGVPLKDRSGTIIKECRRETRDRRIDNIQAAWVNINS